MEIVSLALALGSIVFSAGAAWQAMRSSERYANGLGGKMRALDERERKHHAKLLEVLLASHDTEQREAARRMVGEL